MQAQVTFAAAIAGTDGAQPFEPGRTIAFTPQRVAQGQRHGMQIVGSPGQLEFAPANQVSDAGVIVITPAFGHPFPHSGVHQPVFPQLGPGHQVEPVPAA